MKIKTATLLRLILAALGLLLVPVYMLVKQDWIVYVAAGAVFASGIIYGIFSRCPSCKQRIGMRNTSVCPNCHQRIDQQ